MGDDKGAGLLTERCQQPRPHGTDATYTVDFSNNQDMFNSFSNAWYGQDKRLIIANDNYMVRFEFK